MMKFKLLPILLLLVTPAMAQEAVKPVKLMTLRPVETGLKRQFFGQVVARQTVDLAFQVGGQIVELPISEGQTIAEGDLIARLDLEAFELALDQAIVQRDQAARAVDRLEQLSSNTVSAVTVEDTRTQLELAELAVRNARRELSRATLAAPFEAIVATRQVANFTTIGAGTPVARLHDMSELRIEIDVPEILFQSVDENLAVEMTAKFPSSEEIYPVEVREFNAETSTVGQTFRITLALPAPEGLRILPGSSVTVTAEAMGLATQLRVPASALALAPDGDVSVLLMDPAGGDTGTLVKTPVEIEPAGDGGFLVLSGLSAGDEIVVAGVAGLSDGQAVRRFTGFSN